MYQRQLTFREALVKVLSNNYCNFSGRASRSEFWWFTLFTSILGCICNLFDFYSTTLGYALASGVSLALLLPCLGLSWRRMHDIGKRGGWIFINLIPAIGWIIFLILCAQASQPGPNRFGEEPNMVY